MRRSVLTLNVEILGVGRGWHARCEQGRTTPHVISRVDIRVLVCNDVVDLGVAKFFGLLFRQKFFHSIVLFLQLGLLVNRFLRLWVNDHCLPCDPITVHAGQIVGTLKGLCVVDRRRGSYILLGIDEHTFEEGWALPVLPDLLKNLLPPIAEQVKLPVVFGEHLLD